MDELAVTFTHPRTSERFRAETTPGCTGQEAIAGLLVGDDQGPFLEPAPTGRPYELVLVRTRSTITPNMTFGIAGVRDGDEIEVLQRGIGA